MNSHHPTQAYSTGFNHKKEYVFSLTCFFLIGSFFLSSKSEATLALQASIPSLTEQADRIVYGEVIKHSVLPHRGTNGEIYTRISLSVFEYWKGQGSDELTIQMLGGTLGDFTLHVSGTPQFELGQKVIVFLKHDKVSELNHILALSQGVFYLDEDQHHWKKSRLIQLNPTSSSNPKIYQDLTGLSFYVPQPNDPLIIEAQNVPHQIRRFKDLKRHIARALINPMTVEISPRPLLHLKQGD